MTRGLRITRTGGRWAAAFALALVAGGCSLSADYEVALPSGDGPTPTDLALVESLTEPPEWADATVFEATGVRAYRERLRIEGPNGTVDRRSEATAGPWAISQVITATTRGSEAPETRVVATEDGTWARFGDGPEWYEEPFFLYEAGLELGVLADAAFVTEALTYVGDDEMDGRPVERYRGDPGGNYAIVAIGPEATAQFDYWIDETGVVLRIEGTIADGADQYLYQYDLYDLDADIIVDPPDPADRVVYD